MKELPTLDAKAASSAYFWSTVGGAYYGLLAKWIAVRDGMYEVPGRLFDARHGVDTCGMVQIPELDIPETSRPQAGRYQPTKIAVFSYLIRRLPLGDRSQWAFVDFGCGKGRCLLLAARAGFGKVSGIELSEPLSAAARRNADEFMLGRHASTIETQCTDAAAAVLPDRPSVYFFYNPFGEKVMADTLHRLDRHLTATGHEAYTVYVNPMHSSAIADGGFHLLDCGVRRSEEWSIWHRPGASPARSLSQAA